MGPVDPPVVVIPRVRFKALGTLDPSEQPRRATLVSLSEALSREWETDAHLVLYLPTPLELGEPVFRLKKEILPEVIRVGGDILISVIMLDLDTGVGGNHVPWTTASWAAFEGGLRAAVESFPAFAVRLRQAAVFYTTRKGARWLYVLEEPVSAREAEPIIRGLRAEFIRVGIAVDRSSSVVNWAQPFRLPKVVRMVEEGKVDVDEKPSPSDEDVDEEDAPAAPAPQGKMIPVRTSEDPFFLIESDLTLRISRASIEPVGEAEVQAERAALRPVEDECPESEEVRSILWTTGSTGRENVMTEFHKYAKNRLVGRESHAVAFDMAPITEGVMPGAAGRSDGIQKLVGQAISLLFPRGSDDFRVHPGQIYALFHAAVEQLTPDQGTPSWTRHLWEAVCRYWAEEDAQVRAKQEADVASEVAAEVERVEIQQRAAEWLPLPEDPVQARAVLTQHSIVHHEGRHWVLDKTGRYPDVGVSDRALHCQVELLEMQSLIPLRVPRVDGRGDRPTTYREMTEGRMISASGIELRGQLDGGGFLEFPQGNANPKLVLCAYRRRRDLVPTYSADVDLWLQALAGPRYGFLCVLIGCMIAFERGGTPIVAFIHPPDSGKKVFQRGMMECLERAFAATGRDLVGRYQGNLHRSPFLWVNEGWPKDKFNQFDPLDMVRAVTTGDHLTTDEKYQAIKSFDASMRVGLFANNPRIVTDLVRNKEMGPDDQLALAQRLCYFGPRDDASKLFKARGKEQWTKGWIGTGEQSKGSDFVVARHFLWLHEKHGKSAQPTAEHHLLVPGDGLTPEIRSLIQVQSGSTPHAVEVILSMLRNQVAKVDGSLGLWVDGGEVAVTHHAVLERGRESRAASGERVTSHGVTNALKSLVVADRTKSEPVRLGGVQARWHFLNVEMLAAEAERVGLGCQRLDQVVAAARAKLAHAATNGTNGTAAHAAVEGAKA